MRPLPISRARNFPVVRPFPIGDALFFSAEMYIQLTDDEAGYLYRILEGNTDEIALHLRRHLSAVVLEIYREMDRTRGRLTVKIRKYGH